MDGSITTIRKEYTEEDITDEAEYYFHGSKTAKEVDDVITNRGQLYLDESR